MLPAVPTAVAIAFAAVRIGNAGLVANSVIGVGSRIALVVRHLLEAAKEIQFKGVGTGPVIHLHQFANPVVLIGSLFCPIVVDFLHQIKGCVGILRHITVCIGLGHQIAVTIVGEGSDVAQSVQ